MSRNEFRVVVAALAFFTAIPVVETLQPFWKLTAAQPAKQQPTPRAWQIGPTLQGHGDRVWQVAFSPDGKRLASSSSDKSVVVWDVAKRETAHTLSHSGSIHSVVFTPDGKTLVTSSGWGNDNYLINFWDPRTGKQRSALQGHADPVHNLTLMKDGKVLVSAHTALSGAVPPGQRGNVYFWDMATKKKIAMLQADMVHTALLSHDDKRMVTAHGDGTVKLWDIDDMFMAARRTVIVQDRITGLRASPDRKTFVVISVSSLTPVIELWDFNTGRLLQSFTHGKDSYPRGAAFSPDGKTLATGCRRPVKTERGDELGGEIKFWDLATGREKQTLRGNWGPVSSLDFSPDGKTVAVGLYHKQKLKLDEDGREKAPDGGYVGVVVLCELPPRKTLR